ncbi:MAG: hypothetical protein O7A04_11330 [Acidobacteria bacterium]|nr:hypothetical protein [Acidobacteriota bacterium]
MRKLLVLLLLAAVTWWGVPRIAPPFYLGGIQVNEEDHRSWIRALERAHMNTVAVTIYAKQGDWDSDNLWYEEEEPWVLNEIREARARGLDTVLVLRVALDHAFSRNKFYWHGMIAPRDDTTLDEWFARYSRFVLEWAEIAQREGVAVLAVGSELNSMTNTIELNELPGLEEYYANPEKVAKENEKLLEHQDTIEEKHLFVRGYDPAGSLGTFLDERSLAERRWAEQVAYLQREDPLAAINQRRRALDVMWRRLIEQVRQRYSGQVTYAANFDQYEFVSFWDELDLISINAYFPLRRHYLPALDPAGMAALLESRWFVRLQRLDEFRRRRGLPEHRFLFTELGYVRRANSTIEPWAAHGFSVLPSPDGERLVIWQEEPEDLVERALAVRGLYRANVALGGDLLAGLLYWKLSTEPAHAAIEPFVLILDSGDPLEAELAGFTRRLPWDWLRRRVTRR